MHYVVIIFLPLYEQSFFSFAVPAIRDFILTIHLNVNQQQNVLVILAIEIVLDFVKILLYYFDLIMWLIGYPFELLKIILHLLYVTSLVYEL